MKISSILIILACVCATSFSQVGYVGGVYSESFDGLPTTTQTGAFSATIGVQSAISGVSGWQGAKIAGTGSTAANLAADTGASNSGAIYSYGVAASTERALGALASGSNVMAFGASFTNDTGSTQTSITITFTSEAWRSSTTTQNSLAFAYGLSGGTATGSNFLTDSSLTSFSSLNVVGPTPVASNGALNPPTTTAVSATFSVNWTSGSTLFIRWQDTNDLGNDAGLAIDNLTLTAIPEPHEYGLAFAGLLVIATFLRRRRMA